MNVWQLQPRYDQTGQKAQYQDCEVTVVSADPESAVKMGTHRDFQNVMILSQYGQPVPASISYKKGQPRINPSQFGVPLAGQVKIEPASGQYAINGFRYTFQFPNGIMPAGGGMPPQQGYQQPAGTPPAGYAPQGQPAGQTTYTPPPAAPAAPPAGFTREEKLRTLSMAISYAKDLAAAKAIEVDQIQAKAAEFYGIMDSFVNGPAAGNPDDVPF